MANKKVYTKPVVVTEKITVGVFGNYGSHAGGNGKGKQPMKVNKPAIFWGGCCAG